MLDINREIKQARNTKQWNFLSIALQRIQDELNGTTAIATQAATNAAALVSAGTAASSASTSTPTPPSGSNPQPKPSPSVPVVVVPKPPFKLAGPYYPLALDITGTPTIDFAANGHQNKSTDNINDGQIFFRMPSPPSVSAVANVSVTQSGTTTAINVGAGTYYLGSVTLSANSGSVDPGAYGTYYVYFDDPVYAGGAETYNATTDITVLTKAPGRFPVAVITTTSAGGAVGGNITLTSLNVLGPIGVRYTKAELAANVALTASTATAISGVAISVTFPASGGPWRVLTAGSIMFTTGGTNPIYAKAWIEDGTNTWDGYSLGTSSGTETYQSVPLNNFSPVTYANSASVTFTPYAEINVASQLISAADQFGGTGTWMAVLIVASN